MKSRDAREVNTAKLRLVVERMGRLRDDVVFLGGTVIPFLLTRQIPLGVRFSKDVDFIIDFESDRDLYEFEDALWEQGFKKRSTGAVCRWVIEGVNVDALHAEPVLGFNNEWCAEAAHYAQQVDIGNGVEINMIPAPCFLGVKFTGFYTRGKDNYATSYDIYDLLLVVAGRPEIEKDVLEQASPRLRAYLGNELEKLLAKSDGLGELVQRYSRDSQVSEHLSTEVVSRIERIAHNCAIPAGSLPG